MMGDMEVRLIVAHPSAETKQIRLGAETLIGRGTECKLRISSGQVSRRHCLIKVSEGSVSVRDLGSANGTRLNDQPIAADVDVPIPPGSTLVVGPLKFVVQFAAPRTTADEDTELLSGLVTAVKSSPQQAQAPSRQPEADGEETKDYLPSKLRRRGAPPDEFAARDVPPENLEPLPAPGAAAGSDAGLTNEPDVSVDSGETIFDGSLDDQADRSQQGGAKPGQRTDADLASETHLLFEEDDLQRLVADIESAATA
jgi:pSer/pThr/pTyr-binding forkhead associated (FHA) protein